jgi:hypothetical protein
MDVSFWSHLLLNAPPRSTFASLDPKALHAVGLKRQQNLICLGLACSQFCKNISEGPSEVSDATLDQLSWTLALFTTLFSTIVHKAELFPILFKLEESLALTYAQVIPPVAQLRNVINHVKLLKKEPLLPDPNPRPSRRVWDGAVELPELSRRWQCEAPGPPCSRAAPLCPAMYGLRGCSLSTFRRACTSLLFRPGVTLAAGESIWTTPHALCRTRRDLVHALVMLGSLGFMCGCPRLDVDFPGFPSAPFLKSVCNICRACLDDLLAGRVDDAAVDLVRNCHALCARLFIAQDFRTAAACVKPSAFIGAIVHGPATMLDADGPLASEALSFIYIALLSRNDLAGVLAAKNLANTIIFNVLAIAQVSLERTGFGYVHDIALAVVLLLVAHTGVAAGLSATWAGRWPAAFVPPPGSFGDLLLNIAVNVCQRGAFWHSLLCILQAVAPFVSVFSFWTAFRLWGALEPVLETDPTMRQLFTEACAAIVQRTENNENGFVVLIFQKRAFFRGLKDESARVATRLVVGWVNKVKRVVMASGRHPLSLGELLEAIDRLEETRDVVVFEKHTHSFRGEMEKDWRDWVILLFTRSCHEEVQKMKQFQKDSDGTQKY